MLSLLFAMWGGLVRLGWNIPEIRGEMFAQHGALMICGFLGTVICLERAVALGKKPAFVVPAVSAAAALLLITGLPHAAALSCAASVGLLAISGWILYIQPAAFTLVEALGAVCWLVGNVLWISGLPLYEFVFWWAAFLILTVAGERLDLSRLLQHSKAVQSMLVLAIAMFITGIACSHVALDLGMRICGFGLFAVALWLAMKDIGRRTIRQKGLPRFIAICLMAGYFWLAAAGAMMAVSGEKSVGQFYDPILHSIFLGFVMSMIFGHAPIIFPAITGIRMQFRLALYSHVFLLHASLLLRVAAIHADSEPLRKISGLLNVGAILIFMLNTMLSTRASN